MPAAEIRADLPVMSEADKLRYRAEFVDDVLSKLADALFEVADVEGWTKADLAAIIGMDDGQFGGYLSGRRSNMNIKTLALIARALRKRPELTLHDERPDVHSRSDVVFKSDAFGGIGGWAEAKQTVSETSFQLAGVE